MRFYVVQPGDTIASIASRDDMAGCKKCARDLVLRNSHRAHVQHPNGWLSFVDPLVVGEQLIVPEKWGDGTLDRLSKEYFEALPEPMGLGQLPQQQPRISSTISPEDTMNNRSQEQPAYALSIRPPLGLAGCCGVPYGTPMGPYGLSYGLADDAAAAPPPAPAPSAFGSMLAKLPASWPYWGLGLGGALALTGVVLMATKR